jgi:hypothetical protein
VVQLNWFTAFYLAVIFYALMLAGVAVMGRVIWWMASNYPQRPSLARCMVFAGYVATPLFLAVLWRSIRWSGCARWWGQRALLYRLSALCGDSNLPEYQQRRGLSFSSSTLAIGVLVLEVLLALTVILWGYGYRLF